MLEWRDAQDTDATDALLIATHLVKLHHRTGIPGVL